MQPVFFERDFTNRVQPMVGWSVGRLRWTDEGGCESATLTASGDWGKIWELAGMLRAPVEIHAESDMGDRNWWGFVNEVRIAAEGYSITLTMDTLANKVAVAYSLVEAGSNAVGERATTSWGSDTISQAEYGVKEALVSGGNLSSDAAEALRDTRLATSAGPQPAVSWGKSDAVRAEVHCKGWFSTLGWRMASWASVTGLSYAAGSTDQSVGAASGNQRVMQQVTNGASAINALTLTITGRKVGTPADNLVLELYALDGSGNATGSALASGSLAGADIGTTDGAMTVTITEYEWAALGQLGLVARRSGSVDGSNYFVWRCDTGVGYTGGTMKLYNGSAWSDRSPAADGQFSVAVNDLVLSGTQLEQLTTTYGAFITGQVFEVAASSTPALPSYRDGDTDALGEIVALMRAGTTNDRRILCQVDRSRRVIWSEEPASTALAYRVTRDGTIFDTAGQSLPLTQPPFGGWALFGDVPAGLESSLALSITRQYIRAVEWTPEDGWKPEFRGDLTLSEAVSGGSGADLKPFVLGWMQETENYAPSWGGATSNPAIGDGTLTGRYTKRGKTCLVSILMVAGSTTTFGSGAWSFSLPFQASNAVPTSGWGWRGVASLYDSSAGARYPRVLTVSANASTLNQFVEMADGVTGTTITSAAPFAWASGDILAVQVEYEIK